VKLVLSKTVRIIAAVTLVAGLCAVLDRAAFYDKLGMAGHVQSALDDELRDAFEAASAYRAKNGKWPVTLEDEFRGPINMESKRPFYYNPQATSGTNEILIAQPVPFGVEVWPFKVTWQHGITADGKLVDL
jgi:hypothetical protein